MYANAIGKSIPRYKPFAMNSRPIKNQHCGMRSYRGEGNHIFIVQSHRYLNMHPGQAEKCEISRKSAPNSKKFSIFET
jgi:hypothetical protein